MTILGIGNVLQKDDGLGVYASIYMKRNYDFSKAVNVINGGVEGINLFNIFAQEKTILILDTIHLDDTPGSIYNIPSHELSGHGLNSGGAHEIGVLQCIDMLELQGKPVPDTTILGMVPQHVTFDMALSPVVEKAFDGYIEVLLKHLEKHGISTIPKRKPVSLQEIINRAKDPSGAMAGG